MNGEMVVNAPWLPGEPTNMDDKSNYVAASTHGWTDQADDWTYIDHLGNVEPVAFMCEKGETPDFLCWLSNAYQ